MRDEREEPAPAWQKCEKHHITFGMARCPMCAEDDAGYSKSRSPAPAITDAQCLAAMREFAAQKGESHDAMWSQMDAQIRAEVIGEWRAVLECAEVSGRSPAEVPPTTFEQIENAALDFARDLDASTDSASGKMAREKFRAVWRSAQQ